MNKRNLRTAIAGAIGMLLLILDGKTALKGAAEGINLCLNTLIPSLFPFFILSILLTGALSGQPVPILKPIANACRIPKGAESLLAIGLLGGYPVGAQNVALLYRAGQLSAGQATRMITFCNNAGPAFIFGILVSMFSEWWIPWLLWAIHILSALIVGILLPPDPDSRPAVPFRREIRLHDALEASVKVMALVCGWVILMRLVLAYLEHWILWLLPLSLQITICGILELANGCVRLGEISSEGLRFMIASGLLSLGGVCVTLQTASVANGISMKLYFPGKLLGCCISILSSAFVQSVCFPSQMRFNSVPALICAIIGTLCIVSFLFSKKRGGISQLVGV